MRLMVTLSARMDTAYKNDYHYKLSGRIRNALRGTKYDNHHDTAKPNPFSFSNPFPPTDMKEGDTRRIIVASTEEELLAAVAENLLENRELNIGEMPFYVEDISQFTKDVGEPGTKGYLINGTGLMVTIPDRLIDKYDIDRNGNSELYWRPKHTIRPLKEMLTENLQWKHELFGEEHIKGPAEVEWDLFNEYNLKKRFATPIQFSTNIKKPVVMYNWRLGYKVKNDTHRQHLNLALNTGLGRHNGNGLGFMNIEEGSKKTPIQQEKEATNAHSA